MKLSKETMEQAAKELGQIAARNKLERLERERGKLPEEERKKASFDVRHRHNSRPEVRSSSVMDARRTHQSLHQLRRPERPCSR